MRKCKGIAKKIALFELSVNDRVDLIFYFIIKGYFIENKACVEFRGHEEAQSVHGINCYGLFDSKCTNCHFTIVFQVRYIDLALETIKRSRNS